MTEERLITQHRQLVMKGGEQRKLEGFGKSDKTLTTC